jgi:hypothetical protein
MPIRTIVYRGYSIRSFAPVQWQTQNWLVQVDLPAPTNALPCSSVSPFEQDAVAEAKAMVDRYLDRGDAAVRFIPASRQTEPAASVTPLERSAREIDNYDIDMGEMWALELERNPGMSPRKALQQVLDHEGDWVKSEIDRMHAR